MVANPSPPSMRVRLVKPIPALAPFIQHFGFREANLGAFEYRHPLPARKDCFLEFYFSDRYRILNVASGAIHRAPRRVLVGPHTRRREDLLHTGSLDVFHINFTFIGFHALFAIPASAVRDSAESAELVLGPSILELEQRLAAASRDHRQTVAESFLLQRLAKARPVPGSAIAASLARSLQHSHQQTLIHDVAARHTLSVRQVERIFERHIGVSPKVFNRLTRLQRALDLRRKTPALDGAALASASGYFDQSHMVRDFRDLTGETPTSFAALQRSSTQPFCAQSPAMSHLSNPPHPHLRQA